MPTESSPDAQQKTVTTNHAALNIEIKPATTSISRTLLKIVFSLYLVIAIVLTGIHMFSEYHSTKDRITHSLKNIEEVVYKSLSITLWNYNIEAASSILDGLRKNDFLEGALITMPTGEKMGFGHIMQEDGRTYEVSSDGNLTLKDLGYFDSKLFGHDFPLYYTRDNGKKESVGHMYVFSSHARVINSVQSIFTLIVVAAIIKTLALWFIFVWAIKTKLSTPLKSFTLFMEKLNIESSTFEPVNIRSSDRNELKLLEETFNNMLQKILSYQTSLEEKENTLKDLNKNLSSLVEHRTIELDTANENLLKQNTSLQETLNELEKTQEKLAFTAHKAGMAEISSGILHTLGTALNSVNIHNQSVMDIIQKSKLSTLMKVNERFGYDFEDFKKNIKKEEKENDLLELYHTIGPKLEEEKNNLINEIRDANEKIHIMISTLRAQQKYAEYDKLLEKVCIKDIILDSLTMTIQEADDIELSIIGNNSIEIYTEKNKLLNILANIILNARESVIERKHSSPKIIIAFRVKNDFLIISVTDNGEGVSESQITDIFKFGYSTRENHDGFGLHNSSNQATEIGGELKAYSDTHINETIFTLTIPVEKS